MLYLTSECWFADACVEVEMGRPVSEWAKMPVDWIRAGELVNFADESYSVKSMWLKEDKSARNACISSLKLYLALCCRVVV